MLLKGFLSYAHADYKAMERFRTHLKAVERAFNLDVWADKRLHAGNYWNAKIQAAIQSAQVQILLMSPSFLASDYIYDHELPAIAAKLAAGDLVIPVILQDCLWQFCVGPVQAIPNDRSGAVRPVLDWAPQEHGFARANTQVSEAIKAHFLIDPKPVLSGA